MVGSQALSTEDRQEVALLAFCVTRACLCQGPASVSVGTTGCHQQHRGWVSQSRGQTEAWCWRHTRGPSPMLHHWICSKATWLMTGIKLRDALYKMRLNPSVYSSIDLVNQHNALRFFSKGLKLRCLWEEGKFKQKAFLFLYIPT